MKTVLFVDDDEKILKSAKLFFKNKFNLLFCQSGQEALNLIKNEKVDLVVSDYSMADGDGLFLKKNLNDSGFSDIPFIVVSGQIEKKSSIGFANTQVKYLMEKPVDFDNLHEKIKEFIKEREDLSLRRKMELMGKSSANILHDINNNLGIIMVSSSVGESTTKDKNQKKLFSRNTRACEQISNIVEKYQNLSSNEKLDLLKMSLKEVKTHFICLRDAFDFGAVSYKFVDDVENENLSVTADIVLIRQSILNLVANAHYALMESKSKDPRISVTISNTKQHMIIEVKDNGPGIGEPYKSNLFKEKNSSKGNKGTGMGLVYCKQTMDLHYGDISLAESTTKGTCFKVKIPLT